MRDPDLDPDLGRMKHEILPSRWLRLLAGVRVTIMKPSSLRTSRLVVGGVGETQTMGGEQVKRVTPLVGGEAETAVAADGEVEGVGVHPIKAPVLVVVVVDGAPPTRTTTLLIRLNRLRRR